MPTQVNGKDQRMPQSITSSAHLLVRCHQYPATAHLLANQHLVLVNYSILSRMLWRLTWSPTAIGCATDTHIWRAIWRHIGHAAAESHSPHSQIGAGLTSSDVRGVRQHAAPSLHTPFDTNYHRWSSHDQDRLLCMFVSYMSYLHGGMPLACNVSDPRGGNLVPPSRSRQHENEDGWLETSGEDDVSVSEFAVPNTSTAAKPQVNQRGRKVLRKCWESPVIIRVSWHTHETNAEHCVGRSPLHTWIFRDPWGNPWGFWIRTTRQTASIYWTSAGLWGATQ
jgi:hypothetical protein